MGDAARGAGAPPAPRKPTEPAGTGVRGRLGPWRALALPAGGIVLGGLLGAAYTALVAGIGRGLWVDGGYAASLLVLGGGVGAAVGLVASVPTLAVAAAGLRRRRGARTVGAQAGLAAGVTTMLTLTVLAPLLLLRPTWAAVPLWALIAVGPGVIAGLTATTLVPPLLRARNSP